MRTPTYIGIARMAAKDYLMPRYDFGPLEAAVNQTSKSDLSSFPDCLRSDLRTIPIASYRSYLVHFHPGAIEKKIFSPRILGRNPLKNDLGISQRIYS